MADDSPKTNYTDRSNFGSIKRAPFRRNPTMMITYCDASGRTETFVFYPKFMGYSLLSSFDRIHLLLDTKRQDEREKRARRG